MIEAGRRGKTRHQRLYAGASVLQSPRRISVTTQTWVPNAGLRLSAGSSVLVYTGDSGPSPDLAELARHADLLVAEATYVDQVPESSRRYLSSARHAGQQAAQAGASRLLLTHLWPGTNPSAARAAAGEEYDGNTGVATADLVVDLR